MEKATKLWTVHTQSRQRGEQTTSRSSALVRGWSTQFIANQCCWPQRPCPKRSYISAIFPPFWGGGANSSNKSSGVASGSNEGTNHPSFIHPWSILDICIPFSFASSTILVYVTHCILSLMDHWSIVDPPSRLIHRWSNIGPGPSLI